MSVDRRNLTIDGDKITYLIIGYHRNGNPQKSQWIISKREEVSCFTRSVKQDWNGGEFYFSLKPTKNSLAKVGENRFDEELYLAKFTSSASEWHGYPADYVRNTQDIPPQEILDKWYEDDLIAKHEMLKIKRGMPCNL